VRPLSRFVHDPPSWRTLVAVLVLGVAPAACARRGAVVPPAGGATRGASGEVDVRLPTTTLLRPGDLVRLRIWREPDLSGEFLVDQERVVTFPKIGPYRLTDESGDAFRRRVIAAYDEYLRNPSIEVGFLRRVGVQGAVRNPGLYSADLTTSVADVLALAGGVAPDGDPDRVDVVRNGMRERVTVARTIALADSPIRSGDQIYVHEESWLRRNTAVVASAAASVLGALLFALAR
jgi:polysaccharide export outer membrane protein